MARRVRDAGLHHTRLPRAGVYVVQFIVSLPARYRTNSSRLVPDPFAVLQISLARAAAGAEAHARGRAFYHSRTTCHRNSRFW